MKLSKQTATDIRNALSNKDLPAIAKLYQERGLTFKRFMWDAYHSIGHKKTNDILTANNKLTVIGGYITDINDNHIETMLKLAFNDCKF